MNTIQEGLSLESRTFKFVCENCASIWKVEPQKCVQTSYSVEEFRENGHIPYSYTAYANGYEW